MDSPPAALRKGTEPNETMNQCIALLGNRRTLELRAENAKLTNTLERLKLEEFWLDHCTTTLQSKIIHFNKSHIQCRCVDCIGEWDYYKPASGPCALTFALRTLFKVHQMDFEIKSNTTTIDDDIIRQSNITGDAYRPTYLTDRDIRVMCVRSVNNLYAFNYGKRLWAAKSTGDAEIRKLASLFANLSNSFK